MIHESSEFLHKFSIFLWLVTVTVFCYLLTGSVVAENVKMALLNLAGGLFIGLSSLVCYGKYLQIEDKKEKEKESNYE